MRRPMPADGGYRTAPAPWKQFHGAWTVRWLLQRCSDTAGGHNMAPMMERTTVATGATEMSRAATPSRLTTTLYDLITALQAVVAPDDDVLVVATVVHLLRSGRCTWDGQ